ncbi:LacI family DNA-binding transcriptional regulator [Luteococcus sp. H138]|uniref:LacI family DNA-binding transcriptional regulator n=1 Tax=unclassified Luteococcus TaxID=2639923 RepID=UPI00313DB3BD
MVTMKDVAQVMGVSVMTVSNAFNRPHQLSPDLRKRILERAERMGYGGPNASARQLRSGRTHAFGVIFTAGIEHALTDPYSVTWLGGLSSVLEPAGASLLLLAIPDGDLDPIRRASVDGFAGVCATGPMMEVARRRGLPVVTSDPMEADGSWVGIDDRQAGLDITAHLRHLGHRRITIVADAPGSHELRLLSTADYRAGLQELDDEGIYPVWGRDQGVLDGLDGLSVDVVTVPRNTRHHGQQAASRALDRPDHPTAVLCLSDMLGLGVLDELTERGLTPGHDVAVTGFDDLPDACAAGLTTIRQPIREKGRLLGELLLHPDRSDRQIILPHELVVRSSTDPAPDGVIP